MDTINCSKTAKLTVFQDLIHKPPSYVKPGDPNFEPRLQSWWAQLRKAAKKSKLGRYLPEDYTKMHTR